VQPTFNMNAMVGISGSTSERIAAVTAGARSRPALMYPIDAGMESNVTCTCPPIRSVSESAEPRYGTCTMVMPVAEPGLALVLVRGASESAHLSWQVVACAVNPWKPYWRMISECPCDFVGIRSGHAFTA
jgi:hypothetical protein